MTLLRLILRSSRLGPRVNLWLAAALARFWTGTMFKLHAGQVLRMGAAQSCTKEHKFTIKRQETANWDQCRFYTRDAEMGSKGLGEVGEKHLWSLFARYKNDTGRQSGSSLIFPTIPIPSSKVLQKLTSSAFRGLRTPPGFRRCSNKTLWHSKSAQYRNTKQSA